MKKIITSILAGVSILAATACSTIISDESYTLANTGETTLKFGGFSSSKKDLRNAVLVSLQERGWVVVSTDDPIKANLSKLRQEAKIAVSVKGDSIWVETKGSLVDGNKPYVPVDYVNNLMASVRKNAK